MNDKSYKEAFADAVYIAAPLRWDGYRMNAFIDYPNVGEGVESVAAHCDEEVKSLRFGQNPMKIARFYFWLQRMNKDYGFPCGPAPADDESGSPFFSQWSLFYLMFFETERLSFPEFFGQPWDSVDEWKWSRVVRGRYYQRIRAQVMRELCGIQKPGCCVTSSPYCPGHCIGFFRESMKEGHWICRYRPDPGFTLALSFKANAYAELVTGGKDSERVKELVERTAGPTGIHGIMEEGRLPIPDDDWSARFLLFLTARYLMEVEASGKDPMNDGTVMLRLFALLYLRFYRIGLDPSRLTRDRFRADWDAIPFAVKESYAARCRKLLIETRNSCAKRFAEAKD